MSLIATFPQGKAEYRKAERLKLAYVKHNFARVGFPQIKYFPDVIPMNDTPNTTQKGRTIPIAGNWWRYIEKINSEAGYKYTRSIGAMWINIEYNNEIPYSTGRAEPVHCGGNFLSYDLETNTHVRVIAWDNGMDTSHLDPAIHNWKNMPHMFWKACAVERDGTKVINVSAGDVYFPLICNVPQFGLPAEMWMRKSNLDLLGEREYTFKDGDVYLNGLLFRLTGVVRPVN